jgi:hypothetical protein
MTGEIGLPPEATEVEGLIAFPFGIYRGDGCAPDLLGIGRRFTLSLIACKQRVATMALQIDCKRLALELVALRVAWDAPKAEEIHGEDLPRAREVIRRFRGER